ncbi:prepilin peptidase [Telmatobacter bradus]|uniref:prepilin peptidase n=1 Tax=Telmatobacter bradus TaxID=474953 RepID=UPI003B43830A
MLRFLGTTFAGLLGLAFGSFLNVCLSRWPLGESVVAPRSHCCVCNRTLTWWENIPLLSWLALGGRCRTCKTWISVRYPLVEAAVGGLWAIFAWKLLNLSLEEIVSDNGLSNALLLLLGKMIFLWLLVALALLDAEHLWLPDKLTYTGTLLGVAFHLGLIFQNTSNGATFLPHRFDAMEDFCRYFLGILAAAGLILLIRWLYRLARKREGLGLGDAKLMALLAAWLGLPGALLAFFVGVFLGSIAAVVLLLKPKNEATERWSQIKLPLGTFLSIGGIVSALWGQTILAAYLRWAGF